MTTREARLLCLLSTFYMTIQAANLTSKDLPVFQGKDSGKALSQAENRLLIKVALEEYTGSFDFADFPSMKIYVYKGELYAETSHGKSVLKKSKQKDMFEMVDYQGTLKFNRDKEGKVMGVELNAQGFSSTGIKRKSSD